MRIAMFFAIGLFAVSPALAHREGDTQSKTYDPNKVICKTEDVIGSRLQSQKHCMTAAQWEQSQREDRNTVDRIQGRDGYQDHH